VIFKKRNKKIKIMANQPKPDSKKYSDLMREIEKGQIKIPKFQRSFVWSKERTASLLDSVLKGYPIGTFILWETTERLNEVKNIGNLELPSIPEGERVNYILDGQQRITSLYAAYNGAKIQKEGEKKITNYSEIYVDLDADIENNDNQIVVSEKEDGNYITLHDLLKFKYSELKGKYSHDDIDKIQEYKEVFTTYDFSTVVLKKEDIEAAIEVFTRINTGGQTLTLFEIMSAKTYDEEKNFDMEKEFQALLEKLEDCKYNTISSSIILFLLALILTKNKECKRKVILQLDKEEIINTWEEVISSIETTIDYFRSVYRIPVSAILPYDSLIVPFAYFFYYQKESPNKEQSKYLIEFFWRISLSMRYSSSVESKLAQDVRRIDLILESKRPKYDDVKVHLNSSKDLINTSFSSGSSYCKAFLCLLAYQEPKDFQSNGRIILDNSWLRVASSKNFHHFFPKAYLRKNNTGNENSLMNITLVSAEMNKRKIRAKAPSIYMQEFLDDNDNLEKTLSSHLIGKLDDFGITSDDYLIFLEKRGRLVFKRLNERINLEHVEDDVEKEIRELISNGEGERLEFKSTLRFDVKTGEINKKLEYVVAKTIAGFLNSDGGKLIIGVDDEEKILGIQRDFNTLQKKNKDGFELHLRQLIKKYLGNTFEKYIKISFSKTGEEIVCLINVLRSSKPVFVSFEGEEYFFVRNGNATIPKNRKEQSEYEKEHWGF
jgi:hypothetical protein